MQMTRKNIIWIFCDIASLLLALFYTNFSQWANWYRMQIYNTLVTYVFLSGYLILTYTLYAISMCIAFPAIHQKGNRIKYLDAGIRLGTPIIILAITAIRKGTFAIIPGELIGLLVLGIVQYTEAFLKAVIR